MPGVEKILLYWRSVSWSDLADSITQLSIKFSDNLP